MFDFSDMSEKFKDITNKKIIAKFKDKTAGLPIKVFIGLRSKMYSMKLDIGKETKTTKEIVRCLNKKN